VPVVAGVGTATLGFWAGRREEGDWREAFCVLYVIVCCIILLELQSGYGVLVGVKFLLTTPESVFGLYLGIVDRISLGFT